MNKQEMSELLATVARVLSSLKLLNIKTTDEELDSVVMRAFLESRLDDSKGMTAFEVIFWP